MQPFSASRSRKHGAIISRVVKCFCSKRARFLERDNSNFDKITGTILTTGGKVRKTSVGSRYDLERSFQYFWRIQVGSVSPRYARQPLCIRHGVAAGISAVSLTVQLTPYLRNSI